MSDSVILQGPDAIKAAAYIKRAAGFEAYDLGPAYGQNTARIWFPTSPNDWIAVVERWRDKLRWFDGTGNDFRVLFDGPPFREGDDIAIEGTPI